MIERKYIDTDYGKISYLYREGKHPLIMLHGLGGLSNNWIKLFNRIDDYFMLIAPDMLGHGKSARPDINYTIDLQSNMVHNFIQKLDILNPVIMGNSYGGWVAINYSLNHNDIGCMVLVDSAGVLDEKYNDENIDDFIKRLDKLEPGNDLNIMRNILNNFDKSVITVNDLKKINVKTLIIWGDNDKSISSKIAYLMNENIKGSGLFIIKNGGHVPQINKPDEISKILNDNLKNC